MAHDNTCMCKPIGDVLLRLKNETKSTLATTTTTVVVVAIVDNNVLPIAKTKSILKVLDLVHMELKWRGLATEMYRSTERPTENRIVAV